MNPDLEKQFLRIDTSICKITSMNQSWAQDSNLSFGYVQILYALYYDELPNQKQISEQWMIPKQTVNRIIKNLQIDGLIIMKINENNKREKFISLTEKGYRYAERVLRPFFELHERIADSMSDEKIKQLTEVLEEYALITKNKMHIIRTLETWYKF